MRTPFALEPELEGFAGDLPAGERRKLARKFRRWASQLDTTAQEMESQGETIVVTVSPEIAALGISVGTGGRLDLSNLFTRWGHELATWVKIDKAIGLPIDLATGFKAVPQQN